jgi:hypothetical protein
MSDTHSEEKEPPKPEQYAAKPALQRWHLLVMNSLDATYLIDSTSKTNYKNGHYLVMNSNDAFLKIT